MANINKRMLVRAVLVTVGVAVANDYVPPNHPAVGWIWLLPVPFWLATFLLKETPAPIEVEADNDPNPPSQESRNVKLG